MKTVAPEDRLPLLERRRNLKMARSAHAFVRGSTASFYDWLESKAGRGIPAGPPIWICGDCHVSNLGPVASADGRVEIALRDLDQTVIGNPAHDIVRLALSLATAARSSDLPGVVTAHMHDAIMEGYKHGLLHPKGPATRGGVAARPVKPVLQEALKRKWRHLADDRIEGTDPEIPLGKRFWPLSPAEKEEITTLFMREPVRKLITCLKQRDSDDEISVADAAFWVKGCSSLGRLRYAALVKVGERKKGTSGFCLIDIKEATLPAAPRVQREGMPRDNARCVVTGAEVLSPFLGERMLPAELGGKPVFLRELMPQDLKIEIDGLTCDEAVAFARLLASILGKAHGRQLERGTRTQWLKTLDQRKKVTPSTPSWLWTNVAELIAIHEKAYLDHCRNYALAQGYPTLSFPPGIG